MILLLFVQKLVIPTDVQSQFRNSSISSSIMSVIVIAYYLCPCYAIIMEHTIIAIISISCLFDFHFLSITFVFILFTTNKNQYTNWLSHSHFWISQSQTLYPISYYSVNPNKSIAIIFSLFHFLFSDIHEWSQDDRAGNNKREYNQEEQEIDRFPAECSNQADREEWYKGPYEVQIILGKSRF